MDTISGGRVLQSRQRVWGKSFSAEKRLSKTGESPVYDETAFLNSGLFIWKRKKQ